MKKETIEHWRNKGSLMGYGYITQPKELSEIAILNALCEWSKDKKVTIYSHSVRRVEENIGPRVYKYFNYGSEITKEEYELLKEKELGAPYYVPYCDDVYYLDIYYQ
jgi:hypothetical protein